MRVEALFPEDQARYKTRMKTATAPILALARILQRAAFADDGTERGETLPPAPLYLDQAYQLVNNAPLRREMLEAFDGIIAFYEEENSDLRAKVSRLEIQLDIARVTQLNEPR